MLVIFLALQGLNRARQAVKWRGLIGHGMEVVDGETLGQRS